MQVLYVYTLAYNMCTMLGVQFCVSVNDGVSEFVCVCVCVCVYTVVCMYGIQRVAQLRAHL
jgi:hypothetical protein